MHLSPISHLLLEIVAAGVIGWLVLKYIPMAEPIRTVVNIVLVVIAVLFLFQLFAIIA